MNNEGSAATGWDSTDTADTKTRILDVAERLIADRGFDATGIDQIAREVGITKSVIYYHFKNKDAILDGILNRAFREMLRLKREIGEHLLKERIQPRTFAERSDVIFSVAGRFKPVIRIMLMETVKGGRRLPLLEMWEGNLNFVREHWGDYMSAEMRDNPQRAMTDTFFFFFLPWIGWYVFEDVWCERYETTPQELRSEMLSLFGDLFDSYIKPHFWGDGLERMLNDAQQHKDSSEADGSETEVGHAPT